MRSPRNGSVCPRRRLLCRPRGGGKQTIKESSYLKTILERSECEIHPHGL